MIERYSRDEMSGLWSDRSRYQRWLDVELAACRQMERAGTVPKGTAEAVQQTVTIDPEEIENIEKTVHHDVIAFLTHVERQAGEPARWLHLGLTSSDVLDTAFALQLREAAQLIVGGLERLSAVLKRRALEFKNLPMVGRTHGIHAEVTSVGIVFAGFYAEVERQRLRFQNAADAIAVGKIAGAVGVYGNVTPEVETGAFTELGLCPESCATQVVARDRHAEFFCSLAQIASTIERFAVQMRHWQRTEVSEVFEPFGSGQKGSSAMPHKRNPILSENLCGLARLVRSHAQAALENVALWHERDISHSSVERVIAPDATILVDFMLHRASRIFEGLEVNEAQLKRNLEHTGGLIFSEAVLLRLVNTGLARQRAYELVQACAMASRRGEGDFRALLGADTEIGNRLSADELDACFDVSHHLRHCDAIFKRVFSGDSEDCKNI